MRIWASSFSSRETSDSRVKKNGSHRQVQLPSYWTATLLQHHQHHQHHHHLLLPLDFYPLLPNGAPAPSVEAGCQSLPTSEICLHSVSSETPCLRRPKQSVKRPSWPFEAITSLSIPAGDLWNQRLVAKQDGMHARHSGMRNATDGKAVSRSMLKSNSEVQAISRACWHQKA